MASLSGKVVEGKIVHTGDAHRGSAAVQKLPSTAFALTTRERKKKMKQEKGKGRGKNGFRRQKVNTVVTFRTIMPDQVDVILPWIVSGQLTNNGLSYASLRYQSNGLYDPDPVLGGTSFIGLSEWATLYVYYRALKIRYKLTVSNKESFPMAVYLYNLNQDPTATVGAAGVSYSLNNFGKHKVMSGASGGACCVTLAGTVPFAALLGDEEDLEADNLYRGVITSSNPADLFYIGFNTDALGGTQSASGVAFTLELEAYTRLYDRKLVV